MTGFALHVLSCPLVISNIILFECWQWKLGILLYFTSSLLISQLSYSYVLYLPIIENSSVILVVRYYEYIEYVICQWQAIQYFVYCHADTLVLNVVGCFFRGGQVSRVENKRGSILPDRYKVGTVLQNESRIICYTSGNLVLVLLLLLLFLLLE